MTARAEMTEEHEDALLAPLPATFGGWSVSVEAPDESTAQRARSNSETERDGGHLAAPAVALVVESAGDSSGGSSSSDERLSPQPER